MLLWALDSYMARIYSRIKRYPIQFYIIYEIHDLLLIYMPILMSVLLSEIDNSNDYMESDEGITITVRFSGTLKDKTVQW